MTQHHTLDLYPPQPLDLRRHIWLRHNEYSGIVNGLVFTVGEHGDEASIDEDTILATVVVHRDDDLVTLTMAGTAPVVAPFRRGNDAIDLCSRLAVLVRRYLNL